MNKNELFFAVHFLHKRSTDIENSFFGNLEVVKKYGTT